MRKDFLLVPTVVNLNMFLNLSHASHLHIVLATQCKNVVFQLKQIVTIYAPVLLLLNETNMQSKHLPPKDFCSDETADVGRQGTMAPMPFISDVVPTVCLNANHA
jgi:hypothetical protein